jgi:outer membrane receptor protein involved in Fe transport
MLGQGAFGHAAAADAAAPQVDEVIVTATRVARAGFEAPTPTTQVGSLDIQKSNVTNIADQLNKVPEFRADSTPATTSHSSQQAGGNFLDLRGLGATRTLVLVDGMRFVPTTAASTIDTNVIPVGLIDHVDVVTGGASAAWGSDAVAGVVNLVLKHNLTGLQGEASFGESQHSDDREYHVALSGGTNFAGGDGNIMSGAEYSDNGGVGSNRSWFQQHWATISNPAYKPGNGQPQDLIVPDVHVSTASLGGVITSGPLKGTQFLPGGGTTPFQYGTNVGSTYMQGGSGIYPGDLVDLVTPLQHGAFMARVSYDFSPTLQGFAEATLGYSHSRFNLSTSYETGTITIKKDNAFLPTSIVNQMTADNITSFQMGRINPDIAYNVVDDANLTMRGAAGLKGQLGGGWTWDANLEVGRTRYSASIYNNILNTNWNQAVDSVIGPNGQPVCRSTLTNPTNGCVPLNLFGYGSPSSAAIAYITATQSLLTHIDEQAAQANLHGTPFSTWAGPVSLATGVEFRREALNQESDANSQAGAFQIGNPRAMSGSYSVEELYAETVVPLVEGATLVKNLDLNAAARVTNYSTIGTVETWKVGLSWALNDEWRVRATRSRDIRAPNLNDLYTPYILTFSTITDPQTGKQLTVAQPQEGNPDLKAEVADTTTAGIVYQPEWLSGLRMSVDYYNIDLKGAVGTLTAQNIINRCETNDPSLCQYITRDATGNITTVVRTNINLSEMKTDGVDTEISYNTPLSRYFERLPGTIDLRLLTSWTDNFITDDGTTVLNTGGVSGTGGPHWRATASVTYDAGPLRLYAETRYVGPGEYDVNLTYNNNHVNSQTVVNTTVQYTLKHEGDRNLQLFATINNLFDAAPPVAPYNFIFGSPTTASLFDVIGRRFTVGARFAY